MIVDCWVIVVIILIISGVFLRSRRKDYALAVLPLAIVPLAHIVSSPVAILASKIHPWEIADIRLGFEVTALVITGILLTQFSLQIKSKVSRNAFLVLCAAFCIILELVLIYNTKV